jgi:GAF domain-containing protein
MNASSSERRAISGELRSLREENLTLYGAIKVVSSSLELEPMLQRVVDLATEATGCHACFIYLLEDDQLTIRAASPVYSEAVGRVRFSVNEGLTGWVARHRTPEFIRDRAMDDPRMKYVPLLDEENFQSMAVVPILSRAGETIGVIVLHTQAPHEFGDDALKLLVHIASLVSGAIENAQLYDRERHRLSVMTGLSQLTQRVAAATGSELAGIVVEGTAALLDADVCQLLRLDPDGDDTLSLQASIPERLRAPFARSAAELTMAALQNRRGGDRSALWPDLDVSDVLVVPLTAGERVGLLCVATTAGDGFSSEDGELARAVAHLAAVAIRRAELIEGLTTANAIKDLFEALAAGADQFAADKAAELRCDLASAYLMMCAEPAGARDRASGQWRTAAEELGRELALLAPASAIEAGPGPVRALLCFAGVREVRSDELLARARELGTRMGAAIGVSEFRRSPGEAASAYREARDAATIARALLAGGGAIDYSRVGAYRYLVQIAAEDAPRDRMRTAVDVLIDYDRRRSTALLDTLERYLSERRSVIESARALHIHPNTLRQRLGRIEELSGVDLDSDDLLSLELAIKLARLHGRPDGGAAASTRARRSRGARAASSGG